MLAFDFSGKRSVPLILQSESTECGLASLAMVAAYHKNHLPLSVLRQRFAISQKGATLAQLATVSEAIGFVARPIRLDLDGLAFLAMPCVVHLYPAHFAVLTSVHGDQVLLNDPASGRRTLKISEFSQEFSGVALELTPGAAFETKPKPPRIGVFDLIGKVDGLYRSAAQLLALSIALQLFSVGGPLLMQLVVDHAIVSEDRDLLVVLAAGFLLLALVQAGTTALRSWLVTYLGAALSFKVTTNLLRHLLLLPMSFFSKRQLGDVISRFQSVEAINRVFTNASIEVFVDGLMVLITFAMMVLYSGPLTLIVICVALLYALLRAARYKVFREATSEHIIRAARQNSHFLETIRGIQGIKLFNREALRLSAWQNHYVETLNANVRIQRLNIGYQLANSTLAASENVAVVCFGAVLVLGGGISVGMLLAFIAYKAQFVGRLCNLVDKCVDIKMMGLHCERVSDIAMAEQEVRFSEGGRTAAREGKAIRLQDVSFRYSQLEDPILRSIDLTIEEGTSVAIIGPSGSGKTTLLKILVGLLVPTEGRLLFGGVDVRSIGYTAYRTSIGVVMQDDQLLAGTIAENIAFFEAGLDIVKVKQMASIAAIHDDIIAMPMGYNTMIGDMGTVLSGGQKQRVLLARALYSEPQILFLDEATSHLDVETEKRVLAGLQQLRLTRVLVTHRAESFALANRIIRIESGTVTKDFRPIGPQHEAATAARSDIPAAC